MEKGLRVSVLFFGLLMSGICLAQEPVLLLTHKNTGEIKQYSIGQRFGYVSKNDSTQKTEWGKITAINNSSVEVDGQKILFEDIDRVERNRFGQYFVAVVTLPASLVGVVWFTAGAFFFTFGIFNASDAFEPFGTADTFIGGGILDMTIGLTLMFSPLLIKMIKNKQYTTSDGWQFSVKTFTP